MGDSDTFPNGRRERHLTWKSTRANRGGEHPDPRKDCGDGAPTARACSSVVRGAARPARPGVPRGPAWRTSTPERALGRLGPPAAPLPAPPQSRDTFPASDWLPAPGGAGETQVICRSARAASGPRAGGGCPGRSICQRRGGLGTPAESRRRSPASLSQPQAQVGGPDPAKAERGAGAGGAQPGRPSNGSPHPVACACACACASRPDAPDRRRAGTPAVTSRRRAGRGRGPRRDRVPSGP